MPYGYNGSILHIDVDAQTWRVETGDERFWRTYVGGGLAATRILLRDLPAGTDPLDEKNLLIFATSVVAGQNGPGLARFTTCTKSPMTNGIGETRTEGPWGVALKHSGFDLIVIRGKAAKPITLVIDSHGVRFHPAQDLWGLKVGEATDRLKEAYGEQASVATIGPAGEKLVRFASIVTERSYQAARMGVGAVMGSKNIKAVVLAKGEEGISPPVYNPAELQKIASQFQQKALQNELSSWQFEQPGFSCWVYLHGVDAALCVNNYTESQHPKIEAYAEEKFLEHEITELGCPHCPLRCIKAVHPSAKKGDRRADGIHQEAAGALGINLGVEDLNTVLLANRSCNEYGMDPNSLGFTLSCAMELKVHSLLPVANSVDIPAFGDSDGILNLIEKIAHRDGIGDRLADGSLRFARSIGSEAEQYAMQVKGLELVPFEPRSQTNLALGYAIAPFGPRYEVCEHDWDFDTQVGWNHTLELSRTLGILDRIPMNYIGPDKVRNFKALATLWSAADALDICLFAIAPTRLLSLRDMADLTYAVTGWETSSWEIMRIGERRLHLMRYFNAREGITGTSDHLPPRFYREAIRGEKRKGDIINKKSFTEAVSTLYKMMGWDQFGVPSRETMIEALLDDVFKGK